MAARMLDGLPTTTTAQPHFHQSLFLAQRPMAQTTITTMLFLCVSLFPTAVLSQVTSCSIGENWGVRLPLLVAMLISRNFYLRLLLPRHQRNSRSLGQLPFNRVVIVRLPGERTKPLNSAHHYLVSLRQS